MPTEKVQLTAACDAVTSPRLPTGAWAYDTPALARPEPMAATASAAVAAETFWTSAWTAATDKGLVSVDTALSLLQAATAASVTRIPVLRRDMRMRETPLESGTATDSVTVRLT